MSVSSNLAVQTHKRRNYRLFFEVLKKWWFRQKRKRTIVLTVVLCVTLLLALFGYWQYTTLNNAAKDTVRSIQTHLQNMRDIAQPQSTTSAQSSAFDERLRKVRSELDGIRGDVDRFNDQMSQRGWLLAIARITPLGGRVKAADDMLQIGHLLIQSGYEGLDIATLVLDNVSPENIAATNTAPFPLNAVRQHTAALTTNLTQSCRIFDTLADNQLQSFGDVQRTLERWRPDIKNVCSGIGQSGQYLDIAARLLGLDGKPATYLILIQDTSELRATGGFIGNYGIITVENAKTTSTVVDNTYNLDDGYRTAHGPLLVPSLYRQWWPWVALWGLRDANLGPDFPDTARRAYQLAAIEGAISTAPDGVIAINPHLIEDLLEYVGPIHIVSPEYKIDEVIDKTNLVSKIHYYQLQYDQYGSTSFYERKAFTRLLAYALIEQLKNLPKGKLGDLVKIVTDNIMSKDVLLYFYNKQAEALLAAHQLNGGILQAGDGKTTATDDYIYPVEDNIGSNKSTLFVKRTAEMKLSFDANGSAQHQLNLNYDFNQNPSAIEGGPNPAYKGYLRLYLPQNTQAVERQGFKRKDTVVEQYNCQVWGQSTVIEPLKQMSGTVQWSVPNQLQTLPDGKQRYTLNVQKQPASTLQYRIQLTPPSGKHVATALINGQAVALTNRDSDVMLFDSTLTNDLRVEVVLEPN